MIVQGYHELLKVKHPVLNEVETHFLRDFKGKNVENLNLRIFEIQPGTENPLHTHAYSHDLFVIRGTGVVRLENGEQLIIEGDVASIASDEPYAFANDGEEVLQFLCMDCTVTET